MTTLLCRVCWNSEGWRRPTGEARRLEVQSYIAKNGFGHEEWLFNREWMLEGNRYGFIQGLNSSRSRYAGQSLDLQLYTYTPSGNWASAGSVEGAYVLTEADAEVVVAYARKRGWLDSMRADLVRLGISVKPLSTATPKELVNVRFGTDSYRLLEPVVPFTDQAVFARRYRRYKAYALTDSGVMSVERADARTRKSSTSLKSGIQRARRATAAGLQDPKHDRLQNAVYAFLSKECEGVQYEADWVDLRATIDGVEHFFEVKAASTAKRCIREAVGQLLEYAHYPDRDKPFPLVVVGDAPLSSDDRKYLALLTARFGLPILYWQFDWEARRLMGIPTRQGL